MWLDTLNDRLEDYLVKHSSAQYSKPRRNKQRADQTFFAAQPTENDQVRAAIAQLPSMDKMTLLGQLLLMIVFGVIVSAVGISILFIVI